MKSNDSKIINELELLKLREQLCFPIYLCSKEITGKYNELLKPIDLTYTQYVVMMYFWDKDSSNLKDISKALLLDASTLSPIIKKLEAKGFLERRRLETDERNLVISLTQKGVEVQEKALETTGKVMEFFEFTPEETTTLRVLILKILEHSVDKF